MALEVLRAAPGQRVVGDALHPVGHPHVAIRLKEVAERPHHVGRHARLVPLLRIAPRRVLVAGKEPVRLLVHLVDVLDGGLGLVEIGLLARVEVEEHRQLQRLGQRHAVLDDVLLLAERPFLPTLRIHRLRVREERSVLGELHHLQHPLKVEHVASAPLRAHAPLALEVRGKRLHETVPVAVLLSVGHRRPEEDDERPLARGRRKRREEVAVRRIRVRVNPVEVALHDRVQRGCVHELRDARHAVELVGRLFVGPPHPRLPELLALAVLRFVVAVVDALGEEDAVERTRPQLRVERIPELLGMSRHAVRLPAQELLQMPLRTDRRDRRLLERAEGSSRSRTQRDAENRVK